MKKTLILFSLTFAFVLVSFSLKAGDRSYDAGRVRQGSSICLSLSSGERIIGTSATFSKEGSCVRLRESDSSRGRKVAIGEIVTNYNRYTIYAVVE